MQLYYLLMNIKCSILLFAGMIIGLFSCKNNDSVVQPVLLSGLNVVNASADTLNVYLNGTRQNGLSGIFPAGNSGLLPVPSGLQNYQFKRAGSANVLFSAPLKFDHNTLNSVFVTGESADKVFTTSDNPPYLGTFKDTTGVRFVNASPDAGAVDVFIGDTVKFSSQAYKVPSQFSLTGSGQKKIIVNNSGSGALLLDTIMTFQPNVDYTLFTKGLLNGRGNARFNISRLINTR